MLVKLDNGLYVKNPTFWGNNWYMRFEPGSRPEFVIRTYRQPKQESVIRRIKSMWKTLGVEATIDPNTWRETHGAFPELHPAASFTFSLDKPMPVSIDIKYKAEGSSREPSDLQDVWPIECDSVNPPI